MARSKFWCDICGRFMMFPDSHKCPPFFYIKHEEYAGDELIKIRALDAQEAAEKYAEKYDNDSAEYDIASDREELKITVFDNEDDENGKKFVVIGEFVPQYYAQEDKNDETI